MTFREIFNSMAPSYIYLIRRCLHQLLIVWQYERRDKTNVCPMVVFLPANYRESFNWPSTLNVVRPLLYIPPGDFDCLANYLENRTWAPLITAKQISYPGNCVVSPEFRLSCLVPHYPQHEETKDKVPQNWNNDKITIKTFCRALTLYLHRKSWSTHTAPTSSEVSARKSQSDNVNQAAALVRGNAAVAVLRKSHQDESPRGSLTCALPWGHGWGWVTLPNGVWSGGKSGERGDCDRFIAVLLLVLALPRDLQSKDTTQHVTLTRHSFQWASTSK